MDKQEIISKLKELGINSENCYPKKSFLNRHIPAVGLYEAEFKSDFYFFTEFDKTMYVLKKTDPRLFESELFAGKTKYLVPLDNCEIVWQDKPLDQVEELADVAFNTMTLRQYACIHLRVPQSGLPWLDNIIKERAV